MGGLSVAFLNPFLLLCCEMFRLFCISSFAWLCVLPQPSCSSSVASELPVETVRLAITTYPGPNLHEEILSATVAELERKLAPRKLSILRADLPELTDAILAKKVELVILTAGQYRQLNRVGLRDLVAVDIPGFSDLNHTDGGTIVVRSDRQDLKHLSDLKGKTLAANVPGGFHGFQIQMGELAARGYDPEHFFRKIVFKGEADHMADAALDVVQGRADVAFLALCYLESLERRNVIPEGALRVISEYHDDPPLPCRRSTALYPSWVLATTPMASPDLSREVAAIVLNQPKTAGGLQWGVATDFSPVDDLFRTLKIGPYAYLREWSLKRIWAEYAGLITIVLCALIGVFLHYLRINALVDRRTAELRAAMKVQAELERKQRAAAARIDALQKAGAVAQISSMLAHEMSQPLNAITCFVRGLLQRLEDENPAEVLPTAKHVLERILGQTDQATKIVNNVRAYARSQKHRSEPMNLAQVARTALRNFELSGRRTADLQADLNEVGNIAGNPLEIELLILNLIKNSNEALRDSPDGVISVATASADTVDGITMVAIVVRDNGPTLSNDVFKHMTAPLLTTKEQGLGLGLSIVASIVEAHRGKLIFSRISPHGLEVKVLLPACRLEPSHSPGN